MRAYVGHDLGTGGDKAVLVRDDGEVLASAFIPYDLHYPGHNQVEQDPEDYWAAVGQATRQTYVDASATCTAAKSISGSVAAF